MRIRAILPTIFCCTLAVLPSPDASANEEGAKLFKKQCKVCHVAEKDGGKRQGPNLWGVMGRKAGTLEGFAKYTDAMKSADIVWTPETLDTWLTDPKAMIPGTIMTYKQKDAERRRLIIEFLKTAKD